MLICGRGRFCKWACKARALSSGMAQSSMKSPLHKLLVLCCALYLSGAHWMLLQTTAWTGMLISRSMELTVSEAVETTFDGRHPCRMCSAIEDAKQTKEHSEKSFALLKKVGEVKFVSLPLVVVDPVASIGSWEWPLVSRRAASWMDAPPTPPPLAS